MNTIKAALGAFIAATTLTAVPARAADIAASTTDSGTAFITIEGTIADGDQRRFQLLSTANPGAVVIFDSDGGALLPALEIGRIIHLNKHPTAVLDGSVCASACALMWLAGPRRALQAQGRIGFHAAYRNEHGAPLEDGMANALVGRYLTQLDLPVEAVVFATAAPPDRLLWLDPNQPDQYGITFEPFASSRQQQASQQSSSSRSSPETTSFSSVAHWDIRVDHTLNNRCYIAAIFEGDTILRLGFSDKDSAYLQILNASWRSIVDGSSYSLKVTFGDLQPWVSDAIGLNEDGTRGLIFSFNKADFIREFMGQGVISITWNGREIARLNLDYSERAIQEMLRCQRSYPEDPFAGADPFAR